MKCAQYFNMHIRHISQLWKKVGQLTQNAMIFSFFLLNLLIWHATQWRERRPITWMCCRSWTMGLYIKGKEVCRYTYTHTHFHSCFKFIQTESERRMREAGVKQAMQNRLRSCMFMYCVLYVHFFLNDISWSRALLAGPKLCLCWLYRSSVNSTLHRRDTIGLRF